MNTNNFLLSFLFLSLGFVSIAQENPDSLISKAANLQYIEPEKALNILDSLEISHYNKLSDKQLCGVYRTKGNVFWFLSKLHTSIRFYRKALKLGEANQDTKEIIACRSEIGYVYSDLGQNDSAIFYLQSSIELADQVNDSVSKHKSLDYLAHCYDNRGDYKKAIEIYQSIIPFFAKNTSKRNLHVVFTNLGNTYKKYGANDTAKYYFNTVLNEADSSKDLDMIATIELSLADIYNDMGNFDKALEILKQARYHFGKIGSVTGIIESEIKEGSLYFDNNKFSTAIPIFKSALISCKESNDLKRQIETTEKLALSYEQVNDYKNAYSYLSSLRKLEDSLNKYLDQQLLQDMNAKYNSEQKEKQITLLNKEKQLKNAKLGQQDAEIERANLQKLLFGIGLSVVLAIAILILIGFKQKQKANLILQDQKAQIEEKNKEIVDSITYAKRIQTAILPPSSTVLNLLPNSFILYLPKDIVAGDFYWMEEKNNKTLFAVADCTGHGVPGAMVSVICNNGLNRSVREFGFTQPDKILNKTRELVISEFEKSEEEVKDGMDIALISLEKLNDSELKLEFSGAHNPVWIIRKDADIIEEIKGDSQPIGQHTAMTPFNCSETNLKKGDALYIFSDGFVDQFGGEKGKKFKKSNFKKLLLSIQNERIDKQKKLLMSAFEEWKGNYEQLDDICVIGVRV